MRTLSTTHRPGASGLAYRDARLQIRDCDVLLYRGRSLESRLVRLVTGTPYSHAGLAAWWNERLMVLEAIGRGVVVTPLSQNVRRYDGRVELFTCTEDIPPEDRARMVAFAQRELGKSYGTLQAILLGLRRLLGTTAGESDSWRKSWKLICSHYVAAVYTLSGRDLTKGVSDRFTSPGDLARSPLLRPLGILRI